MPDKHARIIKNSLGKKCKNCGDIHEYISTKSEHAPCGVPFAFSLDKALKLSRIHSRGVEDVIRVPDDTLIILDDSARKLPVGAKGPMQLDQYQVIERMV